MGLFDKMKEPVFLKESSNAVMQLEKLKALTPLLNDEGKKKLQQEIKYVEYGIAGENHIAFELKNSHMPMYILHDIYLENGDLSAQIDYLVFTRKICFVIECKNLVGDIEINHSADFIRTMEFGGRKKKEGIYSPITQNQRHLELIKKIRVESRTNVLNRFMAERYFDNFYKPVVVLANPKTILNARYAPKEIKSQVIRADQLVSYIREMCNASKELDDSDKDLFARAQSFLDLHIETEKDYLSKFEPFLICKEESGLPNRTVKQPLGKEAKEEVPSEAVAADIEDTELFRELRKYRLDKSREEGIKPYFIYNNNELKDLISKMPVTLEMLDGVSGFAAVKVAKYGNDIVRIVRKYA